MSSSGSEGCKPRAGAALGAETSGLFSHRTLSHCYEWEQDLGIPSECYRRLQNRSSNKELLWWSALQPHGKKACLECSIWRVSPRTSTSSSSPKTCFKSWPVPKMSCVCVCARARPCVVRPEQVNCPESIQLAAEPPAHRGTKGGMEYLITKKTGLRQAELFIFYHQQSFQWYTWKTMCTCRNISFLNISIHYLDINKCRIVDKECYIMLTKWKETQ